MSESQITARPEVPAPAGPRDVAAQAVVEVPIAVGPAGKDHKLGAEERTGPTS
jgi:hypothetical protein